MNDRKDNMNEIKSIWDGWEKQCYFRAFDEETGASCATGYALTGTGNRFDTWQRVGRYIQAKYDLPETHIHERQGNVFHPRTNRIDAIIYANNNLKLTPEDFRRIDRETQIEEALKSVERSIEAQVPERACELSEVK